MQDTEEGHMTNNEEKQPMRKLGAAGWTVLLFILAASGSIIGALVYLAIMFAKSFQGGQ